MAHAKITIKCSEIEALTNLDWQEVGRLALSYNTSCKDTFDIAPLEQSVLANFIGEGLPYRQHEKRWQWLIGFLKFLNELTELTCDQKLLEKLLAKLGLREKVHAKSFFNQLPNASEHSQTDVTSGKNAQGTSPLASFSGALNPVDQFVCGVFLVISRWRFSSETYYLVEMLLIRQPYEESIFFARDDGIYFGTSSERSKQVEVRTQGLEERQNARSLTIAFDPTNEASGAYFDGSALRTFPHSPPQTSKTYVVRLLSEGTDIAPVVESAERFRQRGGKSISNTFSKRVLSQEPDFEDLKSLYSDDTPHTLPPWVVVEKLKRVDCLAPSYWDALFNPDQLALPHLSVVQ